MDDHNKTSKKRKIKISEKTHEKENNKKKRRVKEINEHNNKLFKDGIVRKLTPIECERLQSLPDNYTSGISNAQRYKVLGNAFNVEVVKHILSYIRL